MNFKVGQRLGSYELRQECGAGAYGQVFLAGNILTDQLVALKILRVAEKQVERELRGLTCYRDCRHPNLLQIHHVERFGDVIFYTMDAADNLLPKGARLFCSTTPWDTPVGRRWKKLGPIILGSTAILFLILLFKR